MPTKFINLGSILLTMPDEIQGKLTPPGTTISFRMRGVINDKGEVDWDRDVTDVEVEFTEGEQA